MDVISAQQDGFVTFAETKVRMYIDEGKIPFTKKLQLQNKIGIIFSFLSCNLLLKDQK